MLLLKDIVKNYTSGDMLVQALKGVNLEFRKSEFVSILGPSGCGKTTMLNIIGGLDRYTSGDLAVNGVSTKEFKNQDWDAYRNNSIGFVFQSYNLISHQSVLSNVELALTLSGVSKSQRKQRAIEALKKVGLGDQIYKKPNQLSGGQMQRVAIARALINNPEIVLADEPTGALDSETSVQIMEMLKEVAKDRLVIMVTHNPELAQEYSTRIIQLKDGVVTNDSNPYDSKKAAESNTKPKKTAMSFFTALSLSLTNLMTKKARTILTAFAGSIGIIGIAAILALSNGVQEYINRVEEDTLSSYPITIEQRSVDISSMISVAMGAHDSGGVHELDKIYSNNIMENMMNNMVNQVSENDLGHFKKFLEDDSRFKDLTTDIKYSYHTNINVFKTDTSSEIYQINPSSLLSNIGLSGGSSNMIGAMGGDIWTELLSNKAVLEAQYDVIAGRFPEKYNEVVLMVTDKNEITDYSLYALGLKDYKAVTGALEKLQAGDKIKIADEGQSVYTYDEILNISFKLVPETSFFEKDEDGTWTNMRDDSIFMKKVVDEAEDIKIVGILRVSENSASMSGSGDAGYIGYLTDLQDYLIDKVNSSDVVKQQKDNELIDVFTGREFVTEDYEPNIEDFDMSMIPEEYQSALAQMDEETRNSYIIQMMKSQRSDSTYTGNLSLLGVSDKTIPSSISIYPKDFQSKDDLIKIIDDYNSDMRNQDQEKYVIHYTDYVGLMMSSVSKIIDTISLVLIAFVAISLVVSSLMIGIITYISVLERTKEIGILRAIGGSKRDISLVFNAETLIIGFVSGSLGIIVTVLLCIPANIIIKNMTDIANVAALPPVGGIVLIIVSMVLTFIAGLLPSGIAARKDPVVALRTE